MPDRLVRVLRRVEKRIGSFVRRSEWTRWGPPDGEFRPGFGRRVRSLAAGSDFGIPNCISNNVRLRIVHAVSGVVNGLPLSSLVPGLVYELDEDVARRLLEIRAAVAVRSTDSPSVVSLEDISWRTGGVHVSQPDAAHDRPSRRRRTKRRA